MPQEFRRPIQKALRTSQADFLMYKALDHSARILQPFLQGKNPIALVSIGKCAIPMLEGAQKFFKGRNFPSLAITSKDYVSKDFSPSSNTRVVFGDHPIPSRNSFKAGEILFRFLQEKPFDVLFFISGGTSSLVEIPKSPWTKEEITQASRNFYQRGLSIEEMNEKRKNFSAIKGGRLLTFLHGRSFTWLLSDVITNDPSVIASGLTYQKGNTIHQTRILAKISQPATVAVEELRKFFPRVYFRRKPIQGDAFHQGQRVARSLIRKPKGSFWVGFGETEVEVQSTGRGGRTLEFCLGAASILHNRRRRIKLLAFATDGKDGNSELSGAWVDEKSIQRMSDLGLRWTAEKHLSNTSKLFTSIRQALPNFKTGMNFADLFLARVE